MGIIIEGFDEDIAEALEKMILNALNEGARELKFLSKMLSIKAELSIEGNNIVIRKESE